MSLPAPVINLNLTIDPTTMSAADAGAYAAQMYATLTAELATPASAATGTPAHIVGIDKQLGRLTDYRPVFAPRVKSLHTQLVALGYEPRLPTSVKDNVPSYLSYIDPATGSNLGNLNSERFTFMRGALRDKLKDQPHMQANERYASCHLVSDAAVTAVVNVAKAELATTP